MLPIEDVEISLPAPTGDCVCAVGPECQMEVSELSVRTESAIPLSRAVGLVFTRDLGDFCFGESLNVPGFS